MAQVNNISIYKGEAVSLNFTMVPVTDITGWNISFTLRSNANDPGSALLSAAASVTSGANGTFSVTLTHAQTVTLTGNTKYAYDVQRTDVLSEAVLSIGVFTVLQEVLYTSTST